MRTISKVFIFFLIGLSVSTAQSNLKQFNFQPGNSNQAIFTKDTLRILAIMVDFQADKYDATIGTGKFGSHYTKNYNDTIIDPLPHNMDYFDDHLEFAKNYFTKVSNGKLNIKYKTLPDVITVTKMMRDYCPPYKSKDLTLIGNLSKEAWTLAYQKYPIFNFDDYDLFIVFHAGVSNSLNTGSYEINRNLPAIYLGENAFKIIYGSSFKGLVGTGNNSIIKNSIIMPESESRELTNIDQSVSLLQISINGELVSNIGSYLGLPDLYNTETGISAIGRFGLMDGQAMVANLGTFPPEPSAWEKIYLGWEIPKQATIKDIKASISARRSALLSDTTILKVPINDYEYYLIENRQQDALKNGIKLTYKKGNQIFTDILSPDTSGIFTYLETDIKGGVIIDVDEYDAALPGNGIVIWHIDESVINEKIAAGGINNDILKKGVSVVEADGITDIGVIVHSVLQDYIGDGTFEDFWYSGNKAKYYKNKFADDTKPSSKANNGSNSFITMQNFSSLSPKMSFDLSFGGTVVPKYASKLTLIQTPNALITVKEGSEIFNYILTGNDLQKYSTSGTLLKTYTSFSGYKPVYFHYYNNNYIAGAYGNKINVLNIDSASYKTINTNYTITTPLVYYLSNLSIPILLAGSEQGFLFGVTIDGLGDPISLKLNNKIIKINNGQYYTSAFSEYEFTDKNGIIIPIPYKIKWTALTKDKNGSFVNVILTEGNRFYIIINDIITAQFKINESSDLQKFILADIENDGENSIVFTVGGNLYAVSQNGIVLDNYPFSLPTGTTFQSDVLSFNYDLDKSSDFITYTSAGDIFFINGKTAKIIKELNLSTGSKVVFTNLHAIDNAPRVPMFDDLALTVLTENNTLYTWDLLLASFRMIWYSPYSDNSNSSYIPQALNDIVYENLLPDGKIYNWPNPVYGSETNIRFVVNEDSNIKIKVFDMGGQITAEFQKEVAANIDNDIVFNVSNIKSGIYFARVEALSKSGKTEYKIIKIAVIK